MAPEITRFLRQVTFVLLTLASAATEIAAAETRPLWMSLLIALVWAAIAAGLGWFVPAPTAARGFPSGRVFVVLLLVGAASFALEPMRRSFTGDGHALEVQMILALRNVGLALAAFSSWLLCLRLASAVSLFLTLFAVCTTDHPAVLVVLGIYSAVGSVWLMLVYWTGLSRFFIGSGTAVAVEVQPGKERLPWLGVLVAVGLVSSALGLVAAGPQRTIGVLAEWLPTSGGTGDYDPFARGGVNDGDEETRGRDPNSTGMTGTDTFLDSPLPSLYDLFNETYGEPFQPKERERAIGIDSQTKASEPKKTPANNLRPNREFPVSRKSPKEPRAPSDRSARALFEVQGRTPLHVRVTAFDVFDGYAWQEAPVKSAQTRIEKDRKSNWMTVIDRALRTIFAETEAHQFKITSPQGTLVPTPPQLTRFRVGRVNQADFFGWGQERILRMSQRKTPSGITVETESRTVDRRSLDGLDFQSSFSRERLQDAPLPASLPSDIASLAQRWTDGQPQGWPQIASVVSRLRTEYALDRTARVPGECHDPLAHFLLESKRGPDYQFAGGAAVLLRALGYPTRLVSGFYVSPDRYDAESRHTPVAPEDLHFWTEVMLPSGDWLVLEPTPGYEVLAPSLPLHERLVNALMAAAAWSCRHGIELALAAAVAVALWRRRRALLDAAAAHYWRCFPGRTWQECVRRATALLERRGRWAGRTRRPSQTVPDWLCAHRFFKDDVELQRLSQTFDWAAYASPLPPPWDGKQVKQICQVVLARWTIRRWQAAVGAHLSSGASS
jgi:transglutaminase-like putative cysteine protease